MKNYYDKQTFERKDISDATYNDWIMNNNPKKDHWILTPEPPIFDPNTQYISWNMGAWVINDIVQETNYT